MNAAAVEVQDLRSLLMRHGIDGDYPVSELHRMLVDCLEANSEAKERRDCALDIDRWGSRLVDVLEEMPAPVTICPAFDEFKEALHRLVLEAKQIGDDCLTTSWRTKKPHPLRRMSWDLAHWWKEEIGREATAWRANGDAGAGARRSDFYSFLVDLCELLGEAPPTPATVEKWLQARRAHPDDSDVDTADSALIKWLQARRAHRSDYSDVDLAGE